MSPPVGELVDHHACKRGKRDHQHHVKDHLGGVDPNRMPHQNLKRKRDAKGCEHGGDQDDGESEGAVAVEHTHPHKADHCYGHAIFKENAGDEVDVAGK